MVGDCIRNEPRAQSIHVPVTVVALLMAAPVSAANVSNDEACERLAENHGMIASFSRALVQDLRRSMNDAEFDEALADWIDEIYQASTVKIGACTHGL
jgi:fructose-bisphosphate aldolase, class I